MKIRIIDNRKKEKFMMDDEYLNGQAKVCGWQATLVYVSLCRHVNKQQECFPSIKLMQEELSVGRNTILKGIKNLEKHNIIKIEKARSDNGKWLNNIYVLIDKSEWIRSQVLLKDMDQTTSRVPLRTQPCPSQNKTKSLTGTLRKHIEGNTYKETHALLRKEQSYGNEQINELLTIFETTMGFPSSGSKDRWMAKHLLNNFNQDQLKAMLAYCASNEYAPRIGSLEKLWYKRGDVVAGIKSYQLKQSNKPKTLKL